MRVDLDARCHAIAIARLTRCASLSRRSVISIRAALRIFQCAVSSLLPRSRIIDAGRRDAAGNAKSQSPSWPRLARCGA